MNKAAPGPVHVKTSSIYLAGISAILPPRAAPPPARSQVIQELTRAFLHKMPEIPHRVGSERYSIIENDVIETTEAPRISVMIAVASFTDLPAWCERFVIKPGAYAIFEHKGPPKELTETVKRIYIEWSPQIPGLFQVNWEIMVYPPDYDPNIPEARFAYWLPLP